MTAIPDRTAAGRGSATSAVPSRADRVRHALVVDASGVARRRAGTLLRLGGWRVHDAVGMSDALRLASELELDLVVTDMALRDGTGPELLWRLRNDGCAARFIAVGSRVTPTVRAWAAAAGAAACLAKPVNPRQLVDCLLDRTVSGTVQSDDRVGSPLDGGPALKVDAERLDRVQEGHRTALPHRIAVS